MPQEVSPYIRVSKKLPLYVTLRIILWVGCYEFELYVTLEHYGDTSLNRKIMGIIFEVLRTLAPRALFRMVFAPLEAESETFRTAQRSSETELWGQGPEAIEHRGG